MTTATATTTTPKRKKAANQKKSTAIPSRQLKASGIPCMTTVTVKVNPDTIKKRQAKQTAYQTISDLFHNTDVNGLVMAIYGNKELSGKVREHGIYQQDALAWSLMSYWFDYVSYDKEGEVFVLKTVDLLTTCQLRNEAKRTFKTALQRLVKIYSDGCKKLIIDDKKGSELHVTLEDVTQESKLDKRITALAVAMVADNSTEIDNVLPQLIIALAKEEEKAATAKAGNKKSITLPSISSADHAAAIQAQIDMVTPAASANG